MLSVDLNCDVGEGAGQDAALMPLITSANIACGAHAGDPATIRETIALARQHGVAIGAHPGFEDRAGFGRIERPLDANEAVRLVATQVARLAECAGADLRHVKLHGALYNQVSREPALAEAVAAELARAWPRLAVFALAGSGFARAARATGLRVAEEVFADRRYEQDGSLTPRTRPEALITDEDAAVAQVLRLVRDGAVVATDGTMVPRRADTVCLHGDGAHSVAFARRLRIELAAAGVAVKAFGA